jgi:hypothetical protein
MRFTAELLYTYHACKLVNRLLVILIQIYTLELDLVSLISGPCICVGKVTEHGSLDLIYTGFELRIKLQQ